MSDQIADPALRELGKTLHERYQLAARIARATWPAAETSPEAMVAAAATVFIAMNQQLGGHHAPGGSPAKPVHTPEAPACPVCGKPMRAQRATQRGNQPDFTCGPSCDGALWLDRKRRNGVHP
jgi:hypothetical protein